MTTSDTTPSILGAHLTLIALRALVPGSQRYAGDRYVVDESREVLGFDAASIRLADRKGPVVCTARLTNDVLYVRSRPIEDRELILNTAASPTKIGQRRRTWLGRVETRAPTSLVDVCGAGCKLTVSLEVLWQWQTNYRLPGLSLSTVPSNFSARRRGVEVVVRLLPSGPVFF